MHTNIVPVRGFEKLYVVTKCSTVYRLCDDGIGFKGQMNIAKFPNGYCFVRLTKDGKRYNSLIHRIVATAFIPNPKNLPEVNHKDFNKENNLPENLEWVTKSENAYHSFANNKSRIKNYTYKPIIDLNTGVFYNSVDELCKLYNLNAITLRCKLNGNDINKTSFRYA